ncbi:MAG: transglutaminase domain-containing protein, partial [Chitinophagaceae bacterium]
SYRVKIGQKIAVTGTASLKYSNGEVDDDKPLKPLNERVAEMVLKRKEAVCDGYARLFSTLCQYSGIRSEIIVGYARSNINKPLPKFRVNHTWNAVFLENEWHLLYVTWASGYISRNENEFVRDYDSRYLLTPPEDFIRDHYPDDPRWTLLPDAEVPEEFRNSPFKQKSFVKYSITSFSPAVGVIEATVGDTIYLELATADADRDKQISPDMSVDSTIFQHSDSWVFLKPVVADKAPLLPRIYKYVYSIASADVKWLYLLYNDDMVLRYKLYVKQ